MVPPLALAEGECFGAGTFDGQRRMMSVAVVLLWLASIGLGVIAAGALVTYMRRTWQQIRQDEGGSAQDQLMDGIDRIETRLEAMSERLVRLEDRERLLLGEGEER